jgi:hypothetical protein
VITSFVVSHAVNSLFAEEIKLAVAELNVSGRELFCPTKAIMKENTNDCKLWGLFSIVNKMIFGFETFGDRLAQNGCGDVDFVLTHCTSVSGHILKLISQDKKFATPADKEEIMKVKRMVATMFKLGVDGNADLLLLAVSTRQSNFAFWYLREVTRIPELFIEDARVMEVTQAITNLAIQKLYFRWRPGYYPQAQMELLNQGKGVSLAFVIQRRVWEQFMFYYCLQQEQFNDKSGAAKLLKVILFNPSKETCAAYNAGVEKYTFELDGGDCSIAPSALASSLSETDILEMNMLGGGDLKLPDSCISSNHSLLGLLWYPPKVQRFLLLINMFEAHVAIMHGSYNLPMNIVTMLFSLCFPMYFDSDTGKYEDSKDSSLQGIKTSNFYIDEDQGRCTEMSRNPSKQDRKLEKWQEEQFRHMQNSNARGYGKRIKRRKKGINEVLLGITIFKIRSNKEKQ